MAITAADVNKLRQETGAGMMDCKQALTEANGDFEEAIVVLRKKGQKVAAKRADREANEGMVVAKTTADNTFGMALVLTSETDFVSKNEEFITFGLKIADLATQNRCTTTEEVLALGMDGATIGSKLDDYVAKIGEKIGISKYETITGSNVYAYIHGGYRMGVLVEVNSTSPDATNAAKDIAMQVAAMSPTVVNKEQITQTIIDREIEIGMDLARQEGKPEAMVERIAQGRLNKFYEDSVLLNQVYIKDNTLKISEMLQKVEKNLTVLSFKRITLGA